MESSVASILHWIYEGTASRKRRAIKRLTRLPLGCQCRLVEPHAFPAPFETECHGQRSGYAYRAGLRSWRSNPCSSTIFFVCQSISTSIVLFRPRNATRNMANYYPITFNIYIFLSVNERTPSPRSPSSFSSFSCSTLIPSLFSIHDYSTCSESTKMDGKSVLYSLSLARIDLCR